jgi:DNA repair photolyase
MSNPPNPWARTSIEYLSEEGPPLSEVEVLVDQSREILSHNESPDLGFRYSLNPYRGCMHACAYCYARPTHEYLDLGAGTDFDTKIVIKPEAPRLLREAFERRSWQGETVVFSGVTDCYQPLEASLRLTRGCLEVCVAYRNPVGIVTKAPLIERDMDLLVALHREARVHVMVSVPFWDAARARAIEPYVATPQRRVRTIERLASQGIPVGVNVAPIIPGLNDGEIAQVLQAARDAGARSAGMVLLRLPGAVKEVFASRLRAALPLRAERVLARVREARGGALYDGRFGVRQRGEGEYAMMIEDLFAKTAARLGLATGWQDPIGPSTFRRPAGGQLSLFGG